MWEWIVIVCLYVLVGAGFRLLGGIYAAGDAIRSWGRASTGIRPTAGSSS